MIIKSLAKIPLKPTDKPTSYAILPVKVGLLFPGHKRSYTISRKSSLKMIEDALKKDAAIALSFSPTHRELVDGEIIPLSEVSTLAQIVGVKDGRGGAREVEFEGLERVALTGVSAREPYLKGEVSFISEQRAPRGVDRDATVNGIIDFCEQIITRGSGVDPQLREVVRAKYEDDGEFADTVATFAPLSPSERQVILEALDVRQRLHLLHDLLKRELDRLLLSIQLGHRAEKEMEESRRREFLEMKLEEIKKQLGGPYSEERASAALKKRINLTSALPQEIRDLAWEEASRLAILPIGAAEYASVKHYVETLLSLPWQKDRRPAAVDTDALRERIYKEYYGSDATKSKLYDRVTANILTAGKEKGPIICLVGPSGVGKATVARAIAEGLNRELIRLSLGAVIDMAEIKGMNRAFIGATPGMFIRAMQHRKTTNPVIYIEDLEYLTEGGDSSLALALLEVMDSRLNARFLDNYLGASFDFSDALFIAAVRYPDGIPESIEHRIETIEIPGYIENEKVSIAKKHIIPGLLKRYGLTKSVFKVTPDGLVKLIRDYTLESGLLELSRLLDRVVRYVATQSKTSRKKVWKLDAALLEAVLGAPIFIPEKAVKEPEIGVATGLAWTGAGGELMLIECLKMRGDGNIVFTGSLGEVMKESIQAAHSYIRSKADMLG
ncbi:MAG TPA: LON peptidase substrate-binding domain-containing protein, partial [candidate division Zixibacteria bacterium]|nr:LON peptidase substrate-binding domain-containing protein [candidate division Zixibacteria bacterium]